MPAVLGVTRRALFLPKFPARSTASSGTNTARFEQFAHSMVGFCPPAREIPRRPEFASHVFPCMASFSFS